MNEVPGVQSSDTVGDGGTTGGPSPLPGGGDTHPTGSEWSPKEQPAPVDVRPRRMTWVVALAIVTGLPIAVALATYLQPPGTSNGETDPASLEGLGSVDALAGVTREDISPTWVRPAWADNMPGVTAFQLSAGNDVLFANGRHRPNLGVSCSEGQTDVHVTTGGTALIDPQTSGHVVNLTFDDRNARRYQWVAAQDQRALFAADGHAIAQQIGSARRLRFGFTHYMSGPTSVDFDLRGAGEIIGSMAEQCDWND